MAVDFSEYLDLSKPVKAKSQLVQEEIKTIPLDLSRYKKTKSANIDFGVEISGERESIVIEVEYRDAIPITINDKNILDWETFGIPLY